MANHTLDRLLESLDVHVHAFAVCEVESKARLEFDAMKVVVIHFILEGVGHLEAPGAQTLPLVAGSIAIVPAGTRQALIVGDEPTRTFAAADHCAVLVDGLLKFDAAESQEGRLRTICATVTPTENGSFGLFDRLTTPLAESLVSLPAAAHAFDLLRGERRAPDVGTHALCEALMKQCLLLMVRDHVNRKPAASPLLSVLANPKLLRAVRLVLQRPGVSLKVEDLADAAQMSRSAFARAFAAAYGQTPMEFVQRARLQNAARLLRVTDLPVKLIAASTGFASRSHFSRAFRTAFGNDPTTYRRARLKDEAPPPANAGVTWIDKLIGAADPE